MFSRGRDPEPVYATDLWSEQHLVWPTQRALMAAIRDLEDWPRRPMLTVPRDYKSPDTDGVVFWLPPVVALHERRPENGAGRHQLTARHPRPGRHVGNRRNPTEGDGPSPTAGVAVILDFTRSSHRWAFGLPNVYYARDLPEIHDALIAVGLEAERRNVASDDPDADVGPRITVVSEEMNATIARLGFFWENTQAKGSPKTSPATAALRLHGVLYLHELALNLPHPGSATNDPPPHSSPTHPA